MTIKTIAELCYSLRVKLEFALVDADDSNRVFIDVGMRYREVHHEQQIITYSVKAAKPKGPPRTTSNNLEVRCLIYDNGGAEIKTKGNYMENFVSLVSRNKP